MRIGARAAASKMVGIERFVAIARRYEALLAGSDISQPILQRLVLALVLSPAIMAARKRA
ncbi:hypothetical protein [Sphingomonas sp. 1P08PE]|uniref:hypothetical protein n=1 Tax=Sphingomonas sp. 1P08PE TaxID=554122 RepID=UPI0039A249F0